MSHITNEHPIVALATPFAKSAIAIIRTSGERCHGILCPLLELPSGKRVSEKDIVYRHATLCTIVDPKTKIAVDSALVTFFVSPHSYTGEDSAEISIHGSPIGIEKILLLLETAGFEMAQAGEFTKRAFLHGKLDLSQAEAIHNIIESQTHDEHRHSVEQLSGMLSQQIDFIKNEIVNIVARCAVSLDYPDDEIQESTVISKDSISKIIAALQKLIDTYAFGKMQKEGVKIVLAGEPNAGKSSLFNCLIKQERSIVSVQPGTTRDYIEQTSYIQNIPVRLFDTAGLRENLDTTHNPIEQQGIVLSHSLIRETDILLFVVDATLGWTATTQSMFDDILNQQSLETILEKTIFVWNKTDMAQSKEYKDEIPIALQKAKIISISSTEYTNIDALQKMLYEKITQNIYLPESHHIIIHSQRQQQHLCACADAMKHVQQGLEKKVPLDMISLDLDTALKALGSITGEVTTEDILDKVFGSFCVGK